MHKVIKDENQENYEQVWKPKKQEALPWKAAALRDTKNFNVALDVWSTCSISCFAAAWYLSSIFLVQHVGFLVAQTWRSMPRERDTCIDYYKTQVWRTQIHRKYLGGGLVGGVFLHIGIDT